MGVERLPPGARLTDPDRRLTGRHLRRAAGVHARGGRFRAVLGRVRARADERGADRCTRLAGSGWSPARTELAGDHRRSVPDERARRRDRRLDGVGRHRFVGRPAGGRLDRRPAVLALDLRSQPSSGRCHLAARQSCGRADDARCPTSRRLPRRDPVRLGARRGRVRVDRAASLRLVQSGHSGSARRRRRHLLRRSSPTSAKSHSRC